MILHVKCVSQINFKRLRIIRKGKIFKLTTH